MAGLWDFHCHLCDPRLAGDLDAVLRACQKHGMEGMVTSATVPGDYRDAIALRQKYPVIRYAGIGLHPYRAAAMTPAEIDRALSEIETSANTAAYIGEAGLDHRPEYCSSTGKQAQLKALRGQLAVARRLDKTIVLHCVRAHSELQAEISQFPGIGYVVHGFAKNTETARGYLDRGGSLSLGMALIRRPEWGAELVRFIPRDRLLLESDAPDLHPHLPMRPQDLPAAIDKLYNFVAQSLCIDLQDLCEVIASNISRLMSAASAEPSA